MSSDTFKAALEVFAKAAREDLRANPEISGDRAATELLLHPHFKSLLEALLPVVFPSGSPHTLPKVLPEYSKKSIGRPDIAFVPIGSFARAFIELKDPAKPLNPSRFRGHDKEQFERFCNLPTWAYSNFHEIHLYAHDEVQQQAVIVPAEALGPATSDASATRLIDGVDVAGFRQIIETLALAQPPVPRDADEVAISLAHAARLLKEIVYDLARLLPAPATENHEALHLVRKEFRDILYARPAAGGHGTEEDFNRLFAHAFAQTLAYGLLLAREASEAELGYDAYDKLDSTVHPLLKVTMQALLAPQVRDDLGSGLDVLIDTVNVVDPALMKRRGSYDPILYFYEKFLSVFDKNLRTRYGVFFTPIEVVQYQVAAVDRALRNGLGNDGLLDDEVLLLDPACGTGTYLISAAGTAGELARAKYGGASVPAEVRSLADRLFGFEILVGPYAVTHYRLHRELNEVGARPTSRLHVYLADTLSPAHEAKKVTPHLGFMSAPIVKERREADEVKSKKPILAIIANPPYRRLAETETDELVGKWVAEILWEDFKKPVRDAGWGGELNTFPDLYIAFYRWALWKLFERSGADGRGVLSFITNRTFLTGHPYAGVRKCLRERFDRIEIIDLRGDRRGAKPAGITHDKNIFDTETGVCILTAWSTGNKSRGVEAEVYYADVWQHGAFTRLEKLDLLGLARDDPTIISSVKIARSGLDDFRPEPFEGKDWFSLTAIFCEKYSGIETKRDSLVYGFSENDIENKVKQFLSLSDPEEAAEIFHETGMLKTGNAKKIPFDKSYIKKIAFRIFDIRYLYDCPKYVDRPRPKLGDIWGTNNTCLFTLPSGIGAGPAVVCHAYKPDRHAFRGSYGGYAFPLYDRRPGGHASNIEPQLISALGSLYATEVTGEEVFDFIIAFLSAPTYTQRYAADLEDAFPHFPFPNEYAVFVEGVSVGKRLRELETFGRTPDPRYEVARLEGKPKDFVLDGLPPSRAWRQTNSGTGNIVLKTDGSLRLENVPESVWNFSISGFQVVHKWLSYRKGETLDRAMQRQLLDLIARICELTDELPKADTVLKKTLADPVTRKDLGL